MIFTNLIEGRYLLNKIFFLILIIIFTLLELPRVAFAEQGDSNEKFNLKPAQIQDINKLSGDVSPYNGSLFITHDDVFLPGNNGLDIKISRIYNSQSLGGSPFMSYELKNYYDMGPGWGLGGMPRIWHEVIADYQFLQSSLINQTPIAFLYPSPILQMCNKVPFETNLSLSRSSFAKWPQVHSYIDLPNGTTEQLYYTYNYQEITTSNWKIECVDGNLSATSPEGLIYDFGNLDLDDKENSSHVNSQVLIAQNQFKTNSPFLIAPDAFHPLSSSNVIFDVKKVTDKHGNWLKYEYKK